MKRCINKTTIAVIMLSAGLAARAPGAFAQTPPTPPEQPADPYGAPPPDPDPPPAAPAPTPPPDDVGESTDAELNDRLSRAMEAAQAAPAPEEPARRKPRPKLSAPQVFNAPTGHLLPAAVLYSSTGIDTSGGLSSDLRVGLGDVAEFGIELSDEIRAKGTQLDAESERVAPYFLASFKMGVGENRLFRHQPAISLGFRKSFEHDDNGFTSRVASLYLVGSKSLGRRVSVHAGGALWDAELQTPGGEIARFHDADLRRQIRAFGGIEVEPLDDARIMVEWTYAPEFTYRVTDISARDIRLVAQLAWGVRYDVGQATRLEAGVRVNDIVEADLIDAQIFGQLTFATYKIADWLADIR